MRFELAIGDWGDDGHCKCDKFLVEGNISDFDDLEVAYDILKAANVAPHTFANNYEDSTISLEVGKLLNAYLGCSLETFGIELEEDEYYYFSDDEPDNMCALVVALLNKAKPEYNLRIIPNELQTWPTYGKNAKKFGYGLYY